MSRARDTANLGSTDLATQVELDAATFDDVGLRQDIAILALRQAIGDNSVAYNLPNSFIDQFQDSTGVGTFTDSIRDTAGEYISTAFGGYTSDSDTELLLHLNESPFTDSSSNSFSLTTSSV